jgi:hypothetical protein
MKINNFKNKKQMINEIIDAAKAKYAEPFSKTGSEKEQLGVINEASCVLVFKQFLNCCDMAVLKEIYINRNSSNIVRVMFLMWLQLHLHYEVETKGECGISSLNMLWSLASALIDSPFKELYLATVLCLYDSLKEKFNYELPSDYFFGCCA